MDNNDPESRKKELELGQNYSKSNKIIATLQKEMSFRQAIENSIPSGIAVVDDKGKQVLQA